MCSYHRDQATVPRAVVNHPVTRPIYAYYIIRLYSILILHSSNVLSNFSDMFINVCVFLEFSRKKHARTMLISLNISFRLKKIRGQGVTCLSFFLLQL